MYVTVKTPGLFFELGLHSCNQEHRYMHSKMPSHVAQERPGLRSWSPC